MRITVILSSAKDPDFLNTRRERSPTKSIEGFE